ncbi:membrane-associated protein, putative [Bodo saltans]|uniref:Membrane-associated protein, putative n=1 Tax=Bodo saltans TaxID=75058 RepID=A0A0S4ILT9_BODSA|nr:membrane-associated protein, putative [Bodo saltans]|eukprot:CUE71202.1 membrane-associated protein, putative [Bodo saltans]
MRRVCSPPLLRVGGLVPSLNFFPLHMCCAPQSSFFFLFSFFDFLFSFFCSLVMFSTAYVPRHSCCYYYYYLLYNVSRLYDEQKMI